jgi:glycosyltransferase involved in cell wall biosynthesis
VLVTGGYDVANLPGIGYGSQRGGIPKLVSRWTLRLSTRLVANSLFSKREAVGNAGIPGEQVTVIYHGIPRHFGEPSLGVPARARQRMALTVGNVTRPNLLRKGLEPFVRAAAFLPDVAFVLAGQWRDDSIDYLKSIATPNVEFTGRVGDETLVDYYRRAAVYVQVSQHEGFGMSLAEAMLAGCIPVVVSQGAIPEVVGDCGVYAASQQPGHVAESIRAALGMGDEVRQRARERIAREFSPERRSAALKTIIEASLDRRDVADNVA